jgi:EAL domain-containing protein (putative c-di-GMP-specific phosphodiesterase class I)
MLADMQTDIVKLDMALVRRIDTDKIRQTIIRGILQVCADLNIRVIAEGIESREELHTLKAMGIELFQGFYFARPAFEAAADVDPALFD